MLFRSPAYVNHLYGTRLILDALANSDYRVKYFYLPAKWTGKTYTSSAAPAGTELLIPAYTYLGDNYEEIRTADRTVIVPESGEITLTYEEIGSMERLRRAPAYCVVMNNVLLGGTPYMNAERTERTGDVNPVIMMNDGAIEDWHYNPYTDVWGPRPRLGYTPTTLQSHNYLRYEYDKVMMGARGCNYRLRADVIDEIAATLEPCERDAVLGLDANLTGPTYGFDYVALGRVQRA